MKLKWIALLLGTSLLLAACGGGGDESNGTKEKTDEAPTETSSAEDIFRQSCASCHGQNLEGGAGPSLEKVGGKYSEEEIQDIIINGRGSMPKGLLTEDKAAVVAKWLAEKK
jgi:cytochrome c551